MNLLLLIGSLVAAAVLIRIWTGALNVKTVEDESLASVERRHPYLPRMGAVGLSIVIACVLLGLSLTFGKVTSLQSLTGSSAFYRTLAVFALILAFGFFDQSRWRGQRDRYQYFFGFVIGTLVTWTLIAFKRALFETGLDQDPYLMALGFTCIVVGWKFLFGPWSASIKATVLGTFLFWVTYAMLRFRTGEELLATTIAAFVALIPVVVWCLLFLSYHRERKNVVLLAFFSGMLSTAPILFYSELLQRSVELNFFLFKLTPLAYGPASERFVADSIFSSVSGTSSVLLATLVTYMIVGVIEEISKYWVLRHSGARFFRSIDDVLQLAIIVAIGFAFAENIVNPTYFVSFVEDYLLRPASPEWGIFLSSVLARGVLTTMVHVLSTGVLGYFCGIAFFAAPLLRDQYAQANYHPVVAALHRMLNISSETIFRTVKIGTGLLCAILLHGLFDFVVSLPDVIPGNPTSIGALLGQSEDAFLSSIAITLLPSVLYVVGGFWLLTWLFGRKEDMKDFGNIIETQSVVL